MMDRIREFIWGCDHEWEYERHDVFVRSDEDPIILDDDRALLIFFDEVTDRTCKKCGKWDDVTGVRFQSKRKKVVVPIREVHTTEPDFEINE